MEKKCSETYCGVDSRNSTKKLWAKCCGVRTYCDSFGRSGESEEDLLVRGDGIRVTGRAQVGRVHGVFLRSMSEPGDYGSGKLL